MENNIIIKITSEADLTQAQQQIKDLTKESERLTRQMDDLKDKEKEDAEAIKALGLERDKEAKRLRENANYYKQEREYIKGDIKERKQSIKELENQMKAYKTLNGMSGKVVQQLRAMREQLMQMEDAGEFGTQAFIDLSIAAGRLEDQIGDTQQRIRILASDTKNMEAVMGLGDGLAGGFYVATSTAELFGDELEGLQKAFYKVQAAMSVVSGFQQVYNALQKDSAAMVVINTALTKLFTKSKQKNAAATAADATASAADTAAKTAEAAATAGAATAQNALNAAFLANPVGFVLAGVLALTAAIYAAYKIFDKTERRLRAAKKEFERQSAETEYYLTKWGQTHEKTMRGIDERERASINEKKKNHASDLEIQKEELSYLKERKTEMLDYANKAIVENNKQIAAARELVEARKDDLRRTRAGSKARQEAVQALTEAENQYNDAVSNGRQIYDEAQQAIQAVTEKELELAETRRQLVQQTQQTQIDLMREGQAKEIAQIKANYKEQLRQYKGNSPELIALRKKLKEKENQEIADVERKYFEQERKTIAETDVLLAQEAAKALTGSEGIKKQLQVWDSYYQERKYQMEENARLEMEEVNRSTDSEELKTAKRKKIAAQLQADITALEKEGAEKRIEIESQELTDLEIAVSKAEDKLTRAQDGTMGERLNALSQKHDAEIALYEKQKEKIKAQYDAGLINYQDYKKQEWEIMKAITDAEVDYQKSAMDEMKNGIESALEYLSQASGVMFDAMGIGIQKQLDDLDKHYTTDWEEAQKNADKKYITEKEYQRKKAALEKKQAKYHKAQAIIDAGINTALAITKAMPNFILAAIVAAIGAAQIGVIAAKPLAQYAKGRKGGKGEYALVGEKGAEIMYVPQGASIIPNDKITKPETWERYGVPQMEIPALPNVAGDVAQFITTSTDGGERIDYERLGAAVAAALPKGNNVTVKVDRSGVNVLDGHGIHTYLNAKYNGSWS